MKTRCYLCTYVLHNGIPPMEALSQDQAGVIGGVDDHPNRFAGLPVEFHDMSRYSFCEFCLTYLDNYYEKAWRVPGHVVTWGMDDVTMKSMLLCECGQKYIAPHHVLGARWVIQHHVKVMYFSTWAGVDAVLPMDWGMKYGKYNDCDWCEREGVAARGLGDETTGGHVLTICEDCDRSDS